MNGNIRKSILGAAAVALLALPAIAACWWWTGRALPTEALAVGRLPRIRPDYRGIVIPPNIAPLNFVVEEPATEYYVRIHGVGGEDILVSSRTPSVVIPPRPWRELLGQNRGDRIMLDIYAKGEDGRWSLFNSIENAVAGEEIDSHLVYRQLGPLCNMYRNLGIYQRDLENYDESPIVTNDSFGGCINCHSFVNNRPDWFSLQLRPAVNKGKPGMIIVRDGHASRLTIDKKAAPRPPAYTSWRPDGSVAAFAMINPRLLIRGAGNEIRDVFDLQSDVAVVNARTGASSSSSNTADPDNLETFPCWSADGKCLYFCSARPLWNHDQNPVMEDFKEIKYDMKRVSYDAEKDQWGEPETIVTAADTGLSASVPRASPDGRFLIFCMSDYGGFPIYRASTDLYLMELASGKYRRMECNSDQADSWHCWSSNARWIVFSSKRDNGLLARPYLCYIDKEGREHKPFVVPQKDPTYYDTWLRSYNVPELVTGPVTIPQAELLRAINANDGSSDGPPKANTSTQTEGDPYHHQ